MNVSDALAQEEGEALHSHAAGMSDELPVPIAQLFNVETTTEEFLPYLAFNEGVKIWYDDWPIERKRGVAKNWLKDYASIIGTKAALEPFLALVDAELIDKVTHPTHFVIGVTPIEDGMRVHQEPFLLHALVKASPIADPEHFTIGVTSVDEPIRVLDVDNEPLERAKAAMRAAKSPETEYTVDFGHKRPPTFADAVPFSEARPFNALIDRERV